MNPERGKREAEPISTFTDTVIVTPKMVDDYGNHLNHLASLAILEDQRFRVFESVGIPRTGVMEMFGFISVVHELKANYYIQAYLNDILEVRSHLFPGRASMKFKHELTREGILVVSSEVTLAVVNEKGNSTRLPSGFNDLFKHHE